MATTMTRAEVARFDGSDPNKPLLVIVDADVLDVSEFKHPAGQQVLREHAGKDITEVFYSLHKRQVLTDRRDFLLYARLVDAEAKDAHVIPWTDVSPIKFAEIDMDGSPYYNESHKRFRIAVRKFLWESGVYAWCNKNEVEGAEPPRELIEKVGAFGMLSLALGPGEHLRHVPEPNAWSVCGIKPEDVDIFHCAISCNENGRMVCPGAMDGIAGGHGIGTGPVYFYGTSPEMKRLGRDLLVGKTTVCLGITEPSGGTDVAGIQTRAKRVPGGYLVSGFKKFITGVCHADYCTTLVRIEDEPGLTAVLAIPLKNTKGVITRPLDLIYSHSSGTGLLVLESVFVPQSNLLGKEGQGFQIIMHNFNAERLFIAGALVARCRRVVEEAFLWCRSRKAFGKSLGDMPAVQLRLGELQSDLMMMDATYERMLYRYSVMSREEQNKHLGGPTGVLKYAMTRATGRICDQAMNLIGGRGLEKSGLGTTINRVFTSYKYLSIGGGTEDAMLSLGTRSEFKNLSRNARI